MLHHVAHFYFVYKREVSSSTFALSIQREAARYIRAILSSENLLRQQASSTFNLLDLDKPLVDRRCLQGFKNLSSQHKCLYAFEMVAMACYGYLKPNDLEKRTVPVFSHPVVVLSQQGTGNWTAMSSLVSALLSTKSWGWNCRTTYSLGYNWRILADSNKCIQLFCSVESPIIVDWIDKPPWDKRQVTEEVRWRSQWWPWSYWASCLKHESFVSV